MSSTAGQLLTAIETELSQVSGFGTQLYSDDRILQLITNAFKDAVQEVWWPETMQWAYPVLDGVTGIVRGLPFSNYGDIRAVFPPTNIGMRGRPLPNMSMDLNPQLILGSVPKFIEGRATTMTNGVANLDPLQVYPITSTGVLAIQGRVMPSLPFAITDTVPFDDLMITYSAAWMYSVDDGSNPGSESKFERLMNRRMKLIKSSYNNKPIDLDPRIHRTVDSWTELS